MVLGTKNADPSAMTIGTRLCFSGSTIAKQKVGGLIIGMYKYVIV